MSSIIYARRAAATTIGLAVLAGTGLAAAAPSSAATVPLCNSATYADGAWVPGVGGTPVACLVRYGSYNSSTVRVLQRFLNRDRTPERQIAVDGSYGPKTRAAVADFQRNWNAHPHAWTPQQQAVRLVVDGYFGPATSKVAQNRLNSWDV